MQSRREPYLVIKKDNQQIDHKIKILQQIGEKQRKQVSKLMGRQSNARTLQQNKERSINELMEPQSKQNKTQTARKRYRCQDYVDKQVLKIKQVERVERVEALQENNYIWNMHKIQNNEQEREIQYYKSDQYKNYLQKIMKANSKQQKVKLIKENRNNNVYLFDKKNYIQSIIKSKQVLPRVNLHHFYCAQSQYYDEQKEQRTIVPKHSVNNRIKSSINEERRVQMQEKKVIPIQIKKQQLQQSPIKFYPIFQAPTNREKQSTQIITLSPICQTHNKKVQTPPLKEQKASKRQLLYEQQKTTQPQQCNSNVQKSSGVSKQEMPSYNRSSIKNQTYRKELEYCQRQNITDRNEKKKKKYTHAYRYKIIEDKANKENHRYPSSSLSHSSQEENNVYNISFKISHPDQLKKQNHFPSRQYQNKLAKYNQNLPKQQYKKTTPKKYQQTKQRMHTVYNNLECSHTTLATKEVDNFSNMKSNSKMSVVSKSKLKR